MEEVKKELNDILHMRARYAYLILLVVSILAFSQIFFYQFPVKWDMINCFLPWKYQVGECLQSGALPLWNPYVNLGVPINADPSSGAWYPFTWIIGYFKGYSIYLIGIELWIHVFIGGVGFYKLSKTFGLFSFFALLAAMAFMLSGFFVGNAQHLPYVISACWTPFILHYYIQMVRSNAWSDVIKLVFAVFMSITGGYPAFTIILFYLILALFVYYLVKRDKRKANLVQFLIKHAGVIVISLLASAVMIMSVAQAFPYLTRMESFDAQQALFSPFSPQSFVSFLYPYASVVRAEDAYFDSDLSMRNAYFGIITFTLFILSIFYKKSGELKLLFIFGVISLLASVGGYLPVREFLFDYFPLMGVFRFPSVFRLFFIISAIISGITLLQLLFTSENKSKKPFVIILLIFIIGGVGVFHFALNNEAFNIVDYISNNIFRTNSDASYWKHIAIQSFVQLTLLLGMLISIWKIKNLRVLLFSLLGLFTIDMVISTQLNGPSTIYSHKWSAKSTAELIENYSHGFPMVGGKPIKEANDAFNLGQQYWANTSIFKREIASLGFNSFIFFSYENLVNANHGFIDSISLNKVVYLSDEVFPLKDIDKMGNDHKLGKKQLYFNEESFTSLKSLNMNSSLKDSANIKNFGPFFFTVNTKTESPQLLTLLQKKFPGWKSTINGKESKIHLSNNNFMSVVVPKGDNEVVFEFKNSKIIMAFYVSVTTLLFMAFFLLFSHYKKT